MLALLTIAIFCIAIFSAYGGYVDPMMCPEFSVLHLAFPLIVLVVVVISFLWLICRARFIPVCGLLTFIICFPQVALVWTIGVPSIEKSGEDTFTVLTYNVYNGLDYEHRDCPGNRTFRYILNSGADVVCTQELFNLLYGNDANISESLIDSVRKKYPYSVETYNPNYMALITLSKYPIRRIHTSAFYEIRYLFDAFEVDVRGNKLTLINTHLFSYGLAKTNISSIMYSERPLLNRLNETADTVMSRLCNAFAHRSEDAEKIRDYCNGIEGPLVVCGDMNDVPGSWAWNTMREAGLRDASEDVFFGYKPTYKSHGLAFRIDNILYRGPIRPLKVWRGEIRSSDHYPIFARFAFSDAR